MRVALVANRFPSVSETFIYNHAAGLRAAGVDVTVIATSTLNDREMFTDFDGVRYDGPVEYTVLQRRPMTTLRNLTSAMAQRGVTALGLLRRAQMRYGTGRRALRAALLALPLEGFDIVHLEYSGLAVAWRDALSLLSRPKVVVSCRGAAEQITPLVKPERAALLDEVFTLCDRVHCVSLDMQLTCERYGLDKAKSFINRPAIDVSRFRRTSPYVVRTSGPYRLLSTGRLHWKKGIEYALLAIRRLVQGGRDVQYEIIGAGSEEEKLRFAVDDLGLRDHVRFAGRRSSASVREALQHTDVYLLPSLSEGISNAALEAMAMELPIVATTAGGMNEAVTHGVDGMLVPPRDPDAMAEQIARLLDDGPGRAEMGVRARRRIEREFSLERQMSVYLKEYAALIERTA